MKYTFQLAYLILLLAILNFVNPLEETSSSSVDLPEDEPSINNNWPDAEIEASALIENSISTSNTSTPGLGKVEKQNETVGLHSPKRRKHGPSQKSRRRRPKITIRPKKHKTSAYNKEGMAMARSGSVEETAETEDEIDEESFNFDAQYLNESDISCPILKHYTLYGNDFYPPWTYYGFYPPGEWQFVPIEYFTRASTTQHNAVDLKKHKSAMHICSHKVTYDTSKCHELMENECLSDMPSPINIITDLAEEDETLKPFEFLHFDTFFGFNMFIMEDGTDLLYLTFLPPRTSPDKKPSVSKGSVGNQDLFLDRILFHFNKDTADGSEHTINGKSYGMEIQLFFTADQLPYWESLAKYKFMKPNDPEIGHNVHVFSVMVSVGRPGAQQPEDKHEKFSSRFELLSLVATKFWDEVNEEKHRAVQVTQKLLSLEDFLGDPTAGPYYTYEGSLTHPPCLTHVRWTIFENPIWITFKQWSRFAMMKSEFSDYVTIAGNIREQSGILLKLDLLTYLDMRKDEGFPLLAQMELDRELKYKSNNGSKLEIYVVRKYTDFPKYYAKKVRKPKSVTSHDHDYDRVLRDMSSSNSIYYCKSRITPIILMFILYIFSC